MAEHFDCQSCGGPITDDQSIQVDVTRRGWHHDGERRVFLSHISTDRYHLDCWVLMT